jgi:hypothetical protein
MGIQQLHVGTLSNQHRRKTCTVVFAGGGCPFAELCLRRLRYHRATATVTRSTDPVTPPAMAPALSPLGVASLLFSGLEDSSKLSGLVRVDAELGLRLLMMRLAGISCVHSAIGE